MHETKEVLKKNREFTGLLESLELFSAFGDPCRDELPLWTDCTAVTSDFASSLKAAFRDGQPLSSTRVTYKE